MSTDASVISSRKLRANRRNARKSTGPTSVRGKLIASRNAIVHGLYCAEGFILPGESKAQFLFMRQMHIRSLRPQNPIELILVERIARSEWKIRRLHELQHQRHHLEMQRQEAQNKVMIQKIQDPDGPLSFAEQEMLSDYDKLLLQQMMETDPDDTVARKKMLIDSLQSEMVSPGLVRAVQFIDKEEFDRHDRMDRQEQRFENSMDKALRELERMRRSKRRGKKRSG